MNDPAEAWNRAQVLACLGKLKEAVQLARNACNLDKTRADYRMTQAVLFFALGERDAGSGALDATVGLTEGDTAKLLKARFLIAQDRTDDGAQLSLAVSDEQLDLPLTIWTCDWLASKGRFKEALDRLLRIRRSELEVEEGKLAVEARIAACLRGLGENVAAIHYFQDLLGREDLETPSADMPEALLQAWRLR